MALWFFLILWIITEYCYSYTIMTKETEQKAAKLKKKMLYITQMLKSAFLALN